MYELCVSRIEGSELRACYADQVQKSVKSGAKNQSEESWGHSPNKKWWMKLEGENDLGVAVSRSPIPLAKWLLANRNE